MEVGNKLVFSFKFEFKIKEVHLAILFGLILNTMFIGISNEIFEYRPSVENENREQRTRLVLNHMNHKMKVVSVKRQDLRPTKSKKAKVASIEELMKLAKSSKKKKLELKRKKQLEQSLAGLVSPVAQAGDINRKFELDQDFINKMNDQHQKQNEMSTKLLNELKKIIARRDPYFKMCYEKALLTRPNLKGMVEISLFLNSRSRVNSLKLNGAGKDLDSFESCMLNQVKPLSFPKGLANEKIKFNLLLQT